MCDRELDGSSSSLSSAELTLSSNAELGDVESASEPRVVSMLSYLKPPQASTLARKRKIAANPPKGMKRSKGVATNDPKSVCPSDRVKAYPNEPLTVSNKKLFCLSCREELPLKKNRSISTARKDGSKRRNMNLI